MKLIIFLVLILLGSETFAQDKKLCITVDDLPVVSYGYNDPAFLEKITLSLLETFTQYQIPAIGYVNEGKLYLNDQLDSGRVRLLTLWLEKGFELGNHTYSHINYHRSSFEDFTADILKGEPVLRRLTQQYNSSLTYFRHPYLRSGRSKSHSDSLSSFLNQQGYVEAPVTIDNEDYLFAKAYHIAYQKQDSSLMVKIGQDYVRYMEEKLVYFEKLSLEVFGRDIAQTLLTHANLLNAHYYDELAHMYVQHGYRFVSQEEVLNDEAYQTKITQFGDWGISWVERWALSKGIENSLFDDDPTTPTYILELSQ